MDQNIIVNESCRNLRALGRDALSGKWQLGVLGTLLYMALTIIPVMILNVLFGSVNDPSAISRLYNILISGPMTLGYAMFSISIFRKRETSPAEVFYGFERFGKALGLYIVMSIFIILWSLLLIVPGIIAALRYSMSFYIMADNPDMGIMDALAESKRMMQGNKWKLFCLYLSFIGWALLCILTLGIGTLWFMPYVEVTLIAFYDIVNGSLRPVQKISNWPEEQSKNYSSDNDPVTVYKEEKEFEKEKEQESEQEARESDVKELQKTDEQEPTDNME